MWRDTKIREAEFKKTLLRRSELVEQAKRINKRIKEKYKILTQ